MKRLHILSKLLLHSAERHTGRKTYTKTDTGRDEDTGADTDAGTYKRTDADGQWGVDRGSAAAGRLT